MSEQQGSGTGQNTDNTPIARDDAVEAAVADRYPSQGQTSPRAGDETDANADGSGGPGGATHDLGGASGAADISDTDR